VGFSQVIISKCGLQVIYFHFQIKLVESYIDQSYGVLITTKKMKIFNWLLNGAGGFNQPIMCGGEPRAMLKKDRGKADSPIYTMQICIHKHGSFYIIIKNQIMVCDKIVICINLKLLSFL
jgi:hypothetical protein